MRESHAAATANRAWLALREGDPETASKHAGEALATLRAFNIYYPFEWLALWPLTATSVERGDIPAAIEAGAALLAPGQQPQPPAIAGLLERLPGDAPKSATALLREAIQRARDAGFL